MKKISYLLLGTIMAGAAGFSSCTDDFEEVNTNPNKIYDVELGDVWSGTVKRTADALAEANYNRLLNFSRSAIVQFATNPSQDTGDSYFKKFYVDILRDLVKMERSIDAMSDPTAFSHRLAMIKTWKSYCYYILASMYGPIPMSDAISDGSENKRYYKYDSEKEVYTQILADLTRASELFNVTGANIASPVSGDPIYGGESNGAPDVTKWKKFCNSLRLNIAMHVQNIDIELARENALAALDSELFTSNADNAELKFGTIEEQSNSYYYTRFIYNNTSFSKSTYPAIGEYYFIYMTSYNDPRLPKLVKKSGEMRKGAEKAYVFTDTITRPHMCFNKETTDKTYGKVAKCSDYKKHQADGYNIYRRDSLIVEYTADYVPLNELNESVYGWEWDIIDPTGSNQIRFTDPLSGGMSSGQYGPSFVQDRFVDQTATMTFLTYADVCFLRAEACLLFKNDAGSAKDAYESGIRASMEQYGVTDYNTFMNQPGVKWGTSYEHAHHDRRMLYQANILGANGTDGLFEQIYKQRYLADFFNGLEEWNLERRTRALNFPPYFANNGSSQVQGVGTTYNYWTERFIYPQSEISKNPTGYYEGVDLLKNNSPYARPERWNDNVFTHLAFSKKTPGIEKADETWGYRKIRPRLEYFHNMWGSTYEEVVESAKARYIEQNGKNPANNTAALTSISYALRGVYCTYDTPDMPEPEPEPEEPVE